MSTYKKDAQFSPNYDYRTVPHTPPRTDLVSPSSPPSPDHVPVLLAAPQAPPLVTERRRRQ